MGSTASVGTCDWFAAASTGNQEQLRHLAARAGNALLNLQDSRCCTALMIAAAGGHIGCLRILIEKGCDLDAADMRGWTAAMHAAFAGQVECLRVLIEAGAYLDARDFLGTTALMRAALGGSQACVALLMGCGADSQLTDNLGLTAAAHARRKGHTGCEALLGGGSHLRAKRRHPGCGRSHTKGSDDGVAPCAVQCQPRAWDRQWAQVQRH